MTDTKNTSDRRNPWMWIPSLYFAEGIPYVVVMTVAVIMFKRLGISNADITFYTSWLYLPWVIKPLWSPMVDLLKTKRWWIVTMQLFIGAGLGGVALAIPLPVFFKFTLIFMWLLAFSSATHDIAADGFYMLGLNENQQAYFVGIRSTFYRVAMITGQGLLIILAGFFETSTGNIRLAWSITFFILAAMFVLFSFYHRFILPRPSSDRQMEENSQNLLKEFFRTFASFFRRKDIVVIISFLMLYRLGEAQLVKMASPFMLDPRQVGGLGLTTGDVGLIYGTFGILALTAGGILGGIAASAKGLKYWLWWMVLSINVPHLAYVYLAFAQPESHLVIGLCAAIEQFSYGFGFTAYMLYMIYVSEGTHKTAHFAIATGFMALGMMIPGMFSGWLQELIGYQHFFVWVMLCMIPGMIPVFFVRIRPDFGIKRKDLKKDSEKSRV
jgi:PAT family beta-lactamase induction signal transducer AmpG